MNEQTFTTKQDAIEQLILPALEVPGVSTVADYDVDAIADEVLGDYEQGYAQQVDTDAFWEIVAKHENA
ncbi:hypothetical protein BRM3_08810 [Brachybacterium huguangmaarense]|uniref:Uncharacterized protein n=1 Tax=Brachybacterium huguangmaarense TaxID=1652028 RepID=A0ABY6FYG1_9MICO|nr:hypothetical protein [Brachybacterium huguangmaarense]UYG15744.1 hypothetical protein BRM3_08810 [Brachybacterium huguangmaarense]